MLHSSTSRTSALSGRLASTVPPGAAVLVLGFVINGATVFGFLLLPRLTHRLHGTSLSAVQALWFIVFLITPGVFGPLEQITNSRIAACRARDQSDAEVVTAARRTTILWGAIVSVVVVGIAPLLVRRAFEGDPTLALWVLLAVIGNGLLFLVEGVLSGRRQFASYAATIAFEGAVRLAACSALVVAGVRSASAYGLLIGLTPFVALGFAFLQNPESLSGLVPRRRDLALTGSRASERFPVPDRSVPGVRARAIRAGERRRPESSRAKARAGRAAAISDAHFRRAAIQLLGGQLALQVMLNIAPIAATLLASRADKARVADFGTLFIVSRVPLFLYQAVSIALLAELSGLAASRQHGEFHRVIRRVCGLLITVGGVGLGAVHVFAGPLSRHLLGPSSLIGRGTWTSVVAANGVGLLAFTFSVALLAQGRLARCALGWALGATVAVVLIGVTTGSRSLIDRVSSGYLVGMLAAAGALATFALAPRRPQAELPQN